MKKTRFYPSSASVHLGDNPIRCLGDLRGIGSRLIVIEGAPGTGKTTRLRQLIKGLRVPHMRGEIGRVTAGILRECAINGFPVLFIDDLDSALAGFYAPSLGEFLSSREWTCRPLRMTSAITYKVDTIVVATACPGWAQRWPDLARLASVFYLKQGGAA